MVDEAATPEASGTPMDLIGKTVRWEDPSGSDWFTAPAAPQARSIPDTPEEQS